MAKICGVCNKEIKFLKDYSVDIKNGIVCGTCWKKAGFEANGNDFARRKEYSLEDISNSISGTIQLGKNAPASIRIQQYIVKNPGIILQHNEKCYYKGSAEAYHSRTGVIGYERDRAGVSIRIAKGISYHTGGSGTKAKRGTIVDKYPATFYITNDRFILLAEKYGFDLSADEITSLKPYNNGIEFYTKKKTYTVITNDMKKIMELWQLMGEVWKENENAAKTSNIKSEKSKEDTTSDLYKELKQLKELLDMGIITQEEFDAKKKQLLGL